MSSDYKKFMAIQTKQFCYPAQQYIKIIINSLTYFVRKFLNKKFTKILSFPKERIILACINHLAIYIYKKFFQKSKILTLLALSTIIFYNILYPGGSAKKA